LENGSFLFTGWQKNRGGCNEGFIFGQPDKTGLKITCSLRRYLAKGEWVPTKSPPGIDRAFNAIMTD
jgi:hypothetical protein